MSFIAPPPANPIKIDPAVDYNYVIAQQGAASMSVAPVSGFTFTTTFGSPAMLGVKWTDAAPVSPTNHLVTVTLPQTGGGSITHTVTFTVLPTGPRSIPNITNASSLSVTPSQPIDITITADITVDTTNAQNLPGGLAASSGRITGNAPSASGFYVVKFVATLVGETFKRYFVIIVGTGGPTPTTPATPDTPIAPKVFYDGDFTEAQLAGPPEFEIPFATDPKPYAYKLPYWQFYANFEEPALGSPGPLGGIYAGGSPGTIKAVGGGVIEFRREYALVPNTRSEYESHVYSYQFWFPCVGRNGTSQLSITTLSRVQFDYFKTADPTSIDLPRAPIFWETGGVPYSLNGWWAIKCQETGHEVLAEDATLKIWKPGIYERRLRFVRWISAADIIGDT